MIQSPCKNCEKLSWPKDICSKDCEKIKLVQKFQMTMIDDPYAAIDCTDNSRYRLRLPVPPVNL